MKVSEKGEDSRVGFTSCAASFYLKNLVIITRLHLALVSLARYNPLKWKINLPTRK